MLIVSRIISSAAIFHQAQWGKRVLECSPRVAKQLHFVDDALLEVMVLRKFVLPQMISDPAREGGEAGFKSRENGLELLRELEERRKFSFSADFRFDASQALVALLRSQKTAENETSQTSICWILGRWEGLAQAQESHMFQLLSDSVRGKPESVGDGQTEAPDPNHPPLRTCARAFGRAGFERGDQRIKN